MEALTSDLVLGVSSSDSAACKWFTWITSGYAGYLPPKAGHTDITGSGAAMHVLWLSIKCHACVSDPQVAMIYTADTG
jgi:hypothetical protein